MQSARHHIYQSLLWQAIIGAAIWLVSLILLREKPPTPPSSSSESDTKDILKNLQLVVLNKNAMFLVLAFGLVLAFSNTYGSIAGILCLAFGYSDSVSSLFGICYIAGSVIGSICFGFVVETQKVYKCATSVICLIGAVSSASIAGMFYIKSLPLLYSSFFLTGSALALMPVGIDFAVELTHPVAEPISTGLLMSVGNFIGVILTLGIGVIIGKHDERGCYYSMAMLTGTAFLSFLCSLFIKEDLRRLKHEREAD